MGVDRRSVPSRRRQFAAEHELQQQLEKEAATLKEAAQQEAELKEASQEADTAHAPVRHCEERFIF